MAYQFSPKLSFTTPTSDFKFPCSCIYDDTQQLRDKLTQILQSVNEEIFMKEQNEARIKQGHKRALKQKDQVIERLIKSNNKLAAENQTLLKKVKSFDAHSKIAFSQMERYFKEKIKEMDSVITYLENKNEQLQIKFRDYQENSVFSNKNSLSSTFYTRISKQLNPKKSYQCHATLYSFQQTEQSQTTNEKRYSNKENVSYNMSEMDQISLKRNNSRTKSAANSKLLNPRD